MVDASVAVKWLVSEEFSEQAERVATAELIAPDHFRIEVANAILSKARRGQITADVARRLALGIPALAVTHVQQDGLLLEAFEIAAAYGRSVYDALYVALAVREDCQMVTADRKLYEAMEGVLPGRLLWVEDLPIG